MKRECLLKIKQYNKSEHEVHFYKKTKHANCTNTSVLGEGEHQNKNRIPESYKTDAFQSDKMTEKDKLPEL